MEPRQSSLFPSAIEVTKYYLDFVFSVIMYNDNLSLSHVLFYKQDYMSKLKDRSASGAAFFAVCRGKVPFPYKINRSFLYLMNVLLTKKFHN